MFLAGLCTLLLLGILFKLGGGVVSGRLSAAMQQGGGLISMLIPALGVAAIRNMHSTKDIQNTMELSIPVCSMGSLLCLLCIVLLQQQQQGGFDCLHSLFWEVAGREQRYFPRNLFRYVWCFHHCFLKFH